MGFAQVAHVSKMQLLITIHDFTQNLNSWKQTDVILLDLTKAFHEVSHKQLYSKLAHYGIMCILLTWINDFIAGRMQRMTVNRCISDDSRVTLGVPQNAVLVLLAIILSIHQWSTQKDYLLS